MQRIRGTLGVLGMGAVIALAACAGAPRRPPQSQHLRGNNCAQCHPSDCPRNRAGRVREVWYAKDIQPILDVYCVDCHGPKLEAGGLSLASRGEFLKSGILEAESYDDSRFRKKLMGGDLPMAHRGVTDLTAEQIKMIKRWVHEGAKGN